MQSVFFKFSFKADGCAIYLLVESQSAGIFNLILYLFQGILRELGFPDPEFPFVLCLGKSRGTT